MSNSLDVLAKNLRRLLENVNPIYYLKWKFRETSLHFSDEQCDLISGKGVYPNDYMDFTEKYKEAKLPPMDKFYNKLNEYGITKEEYEHAEQFWKAFNITDLI